MIGCNFIKIYEQIWTVFKIISANYFENFDRNCKGTSVQIFRKHRMLTKIIKYFS